DPVAGGGEQVGERVAGRPQARVADVQGAGRVGGDELDVDALAAAEVDPAEPVSGGQHPADQVLEPAVRQADVDEPGSGDLDALDPVGGLQVGDHRLGDRPRRRLGGLGERQ